MGTARAKTITGPIPVPTDRTELQVLGLTPEMRTAVDRLVDTGMFGGTRTEVIATLLGEQLRRLKSWWEPPAVRVPRARRRKR